MGLNDIVMREPRPMPVILLVDNSGSMANERINTVNVALREMMNAFTELKDTKGKVQICIISFGDKVEVIHPLCKVENVVIPYLEAKGKTWMGKAIDLAIDILEDPEKVPNRAYTPTLILLSDGLPTDCPRARETSNYDFSMWEPIKRLNESERLKKCPRLALGIGAGSNNKMLKSFINNDNIPVIKANRVETIAKFFQYVTYSVTKRSQSANPNEVPYEDFVSYFGDDEFEAY